MCLSALRMIRALPPSPPRDWGRPPAWSQLMAEEVTRIQQEHGEQASMPSPGYPQGMLRRTYGPTAAVLLTDEAERTLVNHLVGQWFRKTSTEGEHLGCRINAPTGNWDFRIDWRDGTTKEIATLRSQVADGATFTSLTPSQQKVLRGYRRWLGTLEDAELLAIHLLRLFGHYGVNPVEVPAMELRQVLGCVGADDGHARVQGTLEFLRILKAKGVMAGGFHPLVKQVTYAARGAGRHTRGTFRIRLSDFAIAGLACFRADEQTEKDATRYQWTRKMKPVKGRRGDAAPPPQANFTVGHLAARAEFDRVANLDRPARRLFDWIEYNLTLRRDSAAKGRQGVVVKFTADDALLPRTYGHEFCSLLDVGHSYCAALGHFPGNAEVGFHLRSRPRKGQRGSSSIGGLLSVMGFNDNGTQSIKLALGVIRSLVEKTLGGRVIARTSGKDGRRWLTLDDALQTLSIPQLTSKASWFFFLPADWTARAEQVVVTARAADAMVDGSALASPPQGVQELGERLRVARQRRGLSQDNVGATLGVSGQMVSKWESGETPIARHRREAVEQWLVDVAPGQTEGMTPTTGIAAPKIETLDRVMKPQLKPCTGSWSPTLNLAPGHGATHPSSNMHTNSELEARAWYRQFQTETDAAAGAPLGAAAAEHGEEEHHTPRAFTTRKSLGRLLSRPLEVVPAPRGVPPGAPGGQRPSPRAGAPPDDRPTTSSSDRSSLSLSPLIAASTDAP